MGSVGALAKQAKDSHESFQVPSVFMMVGLIANVF